MAAVNDWLSARPDWLVVFDSVQSYDDIADLIPPTPLPSQHVIITSRHTEWPLAYRSVSVDVVSVDVMDEAEAMQLLKAGAGIAAADRSQDADISRLANELGFLPLALSYAAAYVKQGRVSFADYLRLYMEFSLSLFHSQRTLKGEKFSHAVERSLEIAISALDEEAKAKGLPALGRALLTACAYLNLDAIPRSLLARWLSSSGLLRSPPAASGSQPSSPSQSAPAADVDLVLDALLDMLSSYSLLHFTDDSKSVVRLHRKLAGTLRLQHLQLSSAATAASACHASDSDWRMAMVSAAIEEYSASSHGPALRDEKLADYLQGVVALLRSQQSKT